MSFRKERLLLDPTGHDATNIPPRIDVGCKTALLQLLRQRK